MADYDESIDDVQNDISDDGILPETQDAIDEVLAAIAGADGNVNVDTLEGQDTTGAGDADVIVTSNPDGVTIGDTDAGIIAAGNGSGPLMVELTTSNEEGQRLIDGSDEGDSISVESGDNATVNTGEGDDSVGTGSGMDSVSGGLGDDVVDTGGGSDSVGTGEGNDTVDSGEGIDKVVSADTRADSTISIGGQEANRGEFSGHEVVITDANGETTVLRNTEYVEFADGSVEVFAKDNIDATVARMYASILDRDPDFGGLKFYMDQAGDGKDLAQIAREIAASPEFQELTGGLSDEEYIDFVYNNVFGRDADEAGKQFYLNQIENGENDRGKLVADLAWSDEGIEVIGNVTIVPNMFDDIA